MIDIVLGAGFGDEGKGSIVSKLISHRSDVHFIIRFNGGHQVGHTVVHNGIKHVFSNFGSGSLQGIPTYWSRFCTVHPTGILNELDILREKRIDPVLFIDPLCPIVTPYDIESNRVKETKQKHGSVGVGFGETIKRNENFVRLYAQDLDYPFVLETKLKQIAKYYDMEYCDHSPFIEEINEFINLPNVLVMKPHIPKYANLIFEGGQGILLDQDFGFFPHVTRSNTTSKNAFTLINELDLQKDIKINYVTRSYLTRHGNGPLPFEGDCKFISKNPNETNVFNKWQKDFRYAPLNIDLLNYSLECDRYFSKPFCRKLWITCADQVSDYVPCVIKEQIKSLQLRDIASYVGLQDYEIKERE